MENVAQIIEEQYQVELDNFPKLKALCEGEHADMAIGMFQTAARMTAGDFTKAAERLEATLE